MPTLRLISFHLCPYVQRNAIVLQEKGVNHDIAYIDLADKPDWFVALSPRGKVPVLQVDDVVLFESNAILEYLDETHAPRMHPEDPLQRARDRAWFSVANAVNASVYQMIKVQDRDALTQHASTLARHLTMLQAEITGPLWRGDTMCLMDAVAYPGLQRSRWLEELYPELGIFSQAPGVQTWEATLAQHPSVIASTVPDIRARFVASIKKRSPVHQQLA